MPVPWASRGAGHTIWRDRPMACVAVRARPRPGGAGPRPRASALGAGACQGAPLSLRRPAPLRSAAGPSGRAGAQPWHTRPSDTRPVRQQALVGGLCVPGCAPPAPRGHGGRSRGTHAPTGSGLGGAAHLGAGCRPVAAPLVSRPGPGVPATPSWRGTARGGGGAPRVLQGRGPGAVSRRTGPPEGLLRPQRPLAG